MESRFPIQKLVHDLMTGLSPYTLTKISTDQFQVKFTFHPTVKFWANPLIEASEQGVPSKVCAIMMGKIHIILASNLLNTHF